MTKTLLITYFGPFPGVSVNPSGVTARQVADVLADESAVRVVTREVPVSYAGSSEALGEMLTDIRPDAVLSLGVAVGRDKVSFERVAINLDSADIEDNDGVVRVDKAIAPDATRIFRPCQCGQAMSVCAVWSYRLRFRTPPEPMCATTYFMRHTVFWNARGGGFLRGLCIFPPRKSIMSPLTHRQRLLHMPMLGE